MIKPRLWAIIAMIAAAAASRLVPHPPNLTAVAAMALFGGAHLADRRVAFGVPLAGLFLSDLVLGLHSAMPAVYLSFALTVGIGFLLRARRRPTPIALAAVSSSLLFFIIVDLYLWAFGTMYPKTGAGLVACYIAALPFLRNQIVGDLLYSLVLFGGFSLLERWAPVLRERQPDLAAA